MNLELDLKVSLFGKHPCSSEYIYIGESSSFKNSIINWIQNGYETLLKSRLKYSLDTIHNFYFFNKDDNNFVCGTLKISSDSSGRKYPLVILVLVKHIKYFQLIWKENLEIFNKKNSLRELERSIFKYTVLEDINHNNSVFKNIDTEVLCGFYDNEFLETKLFYKPLETDDFVRLMR